MLTQPQLGGCTSQSDQHAKLTSMWACGTSSMMFRWVSWDLSHGNRRISHGCIFVPFCPHFVSFRHLSCVFRFCWSYFYASIGLFSKSRCLFLDCLFVFVLPLWVSVWPSFRFRIFCNPLLGVYLYYMNCYFPNLFWFGLSHCSLSTFCSTTCFQRGIRIGICLVPLFLFYAWTPNVWPSF